MRRLLAALVVAGTFVAPATPAFADNGSRTSKQTGLGIRLMEAPTALADDPRARVFIIDHLAPGTTIHRKVQVTDGTTKPLDVDMYAAGSQIVAGAWSPYDGTKPNELSRWVSVSPSSLHLEPGRSATAQVTIDVPAAASAGERYAVVWAQAAVSGSGQVRQVVRTGVRVYLSVGPGGSPPTDFRIDSLTAARTDDGHPEVLAQVHNIGGRAVDLSGTLRLLDGPGGLSAGPFPAELGTTLAPGQSEPVTVVLDKALPAGPWRARIVLQSDLVKRAAEATITFPAAAGSVGRPVDATPVPLTKNRNVLIPIAIALLVLAALALLWWLYRRRKDRQEGNDGAPSVDERLRIRA